jgi:hypothetical protein
MVFFFFLISKHINLLYIYIYIVNLLLRPISAHMNFPISYIDMNKRWVKDFFLKK